ncbi:odorant receptor Or1-like [Pieris rapae]|uniref:odorant receptor Or1-like n=1 Tax=Pieris rapae TaxID=64459 RepID=UPI001E27A211|nr:odorant receptor Or1-like [Pieris rapae]
MYEIAYLHQSLSLMLSASMNASKDIVVMALIAQCRCRFRLINIALKGLCRDLHIVNNRLSKKQEEIVTVRLGNFIAEHQDTLETVNELERCFTQPTFAQFTVSLAIICVTAFQLVFQTGNMLRMLSMTFYLLNMVDQVYLYCREGNELTIESENVSRSAYEWPWYTCSVRVRRSTLILMTRCCRTAKLTAGGFTTLSLTTFVSICKASYSFFTVLKQVDEDT